MEFEGDAKKTVNAALKAKAWTFEAKTTHPKAKAIKIWPQDGLHH